jgi:two-component system, chemotaxis family, protein-glutamate methylesterase/glutaminase
MRAELVVMGASLGGLAAFEAILGKLPATFPAPIAIAQHRRADADSRLEELLASRTPLAVKRPDDKEPLREGTVYVAPADYHMLVERGQLVLSVDGPVSFSRPSIDVLFESAADAYGPTLVGVLLTASSEDGADGIAAVAAQGGVTVVQDPETAASPVAARAAIARARVTHVLPLEEIAPLLVRLTQAPGELP